MSAQSAENDAPRTFCDTARDAARAYETTPPHEHGYILAALVNHLRECEACDSPTRVIPPVVGES